MSIARQLENRGSFRKAIKMAVANAMKGGAQGCKIRVSGRLGGADMSPEDRVNYTNQHPGAGGNG